MDQTAIAEELNTFLSRIKRKFPIKKVILYGSFAKKNANKNSDIDLLVLGDFKKNDICDPTGVLYETYTDLQSRYPMHVVGMNTEEYLTRKDSVTLASIRKTGKVVYSFSSIVE